MAQARAHRASVPEIPAEVPVFRHSESLGRANDFLRPRFLSWGSRQVMAQVIQLAPASPVATARVLTGQPTPAVRTDAVYVFFTTVEDTLKAAGVARDLASSMGVPLTILHFRAV